MRYFGYIRIVTEGDNGAEDRADMINIGRSILLTAVLSLVAALSGALADARRDVDFVDSWENGYYSRYAGGDSIPGEKTWSAYYRKHAHVSNGPEKRLANGVRWRLATDQRTRIAIPRIVWMPDNKNRDIANRMLESVQGGAILFSEQQQEGFREYLRRYEEEVQQSDPSAEMHKRHLQAVLELMPKRVVTQSDVALTYASVGFASLVDLGFIFRDEGTYLPRIIRSVTLDLERRRILTMEACPKGSFKRPDDLSNPLFRFADLLEICDQTSLERFEALVEAEEDRTKAVTAGSKSSLIEGCRGTSIKGEQEFVVYLAVDGLAVHLTHFWPNAAARSCPLTLSTRNPLIVPYRALEPLMKPGPLREELLKSK